MTNFNKLALSAAILTALYSTSIYAADSAALDTEETDKKIDSNKKTSKKDTAPKSEDSAESPKPLEEVSVTGRGQTRQTTTITAAELSTAAAGTSPLQALNKLPGVNFSSADSLGNYEWGSRISIRGFNQNQLGFTLDDVPLGDMSYRNYNGLHISRAISTENISKIAVSQGVGALGTASNSNLGGTVQFYSLDPSDKAGGRVEQTAGEYNTLRTFGRFDSGLLGNSDTKFAVSVSDSGQSKWKGVGEQVSTQVNSKVVTNFENSKLSAFFNWSDRQEADYMDLSKDSINRLGYKNDYLSPNWGLAQQIGTAAGAGGAFKPINTANGVITSPDDSYYNGSGLREDKLAGITYDYSFNSKISLKTTAYHHDQSGTGTWWLPDPPQAGTVGPVALRTLGFGINRNGFLTALNLEAGIHKFNAGVWYENNHFNNSMRFFSQANGPSSAYEAPDFSPYFTRWDYGFQTETVQFHAQDTVQVTDRLTANFGFKSPHTTTRIKSQNDTASAFLLNGSLTAEDDFLPQGGLNFKINEHNEVFADAAENIRAYRGVIKGGTSPFDTNQAGFDAIKNNIKPENSLTEEIGWRYRDKTIESSLTGYHIQFNNRLLALGTASAIKGFSSALANVGGVETYGGEAFVAWAPITNIKLTNSISYNDSRYLNNFESGGTVYFSAGKTVVDAPHLIFSSNIAYDDGSAFGSFGTNFVGRRSYTYVGDNSISSYELFNLGGGYRWKNIGPSSELSVRFSLNNILDKRYYLLGDNPIPASDASGTSYNLLAGAPRTALFTVAAKF
jgi:iron complex outermembrane receptor protein